ncbi:hypothetical protein OE88DRAFT_813882 [Heliocybe sulcata]|uniref:DUF6533 domain-containing protein n=1 Tax=Heliocybe sulcata TaxID=5364 RepID=A0A5C3MTK8_9AGAM|nr:hypothetical protein OE88DRAFT_813882 [Heliocybe sulcata]
MAVVPDDGRTAMEVLQLRYDQPANYMNVAVLACLVYDILLTLPREVSLIWMSRWTIHKILYFCNRYVPVVFFATLLIVNTDANISDHVIVESILVHRTWVVCGRGRRTLACLLSLFAVNLACNFSGTADQVTKLVLVPQPERLSRLGCDARYTLSYTRMWLVYLGWASSITVNICYLAILIRKTVNGIQLSDLPWYKVRGRFLPLSCLLVRDSVVYFLLVFVMSFAVVVLQSIFKMHNPALNAVNATVMPAVYSMTMCRAVLHLREAGTGISDGGVRLGQLPTLGDYAGLDLALEK